MSHCSLRGKKGKGGSRRRTGRKKVEQATQAAESKAGPARGGAAPGAQDPGPRLCRRGGPEGEREYSMCQVALEDGLERNKVGGREIEELFTSIYKQETGEKVLGYFRM